MLHVVARWAEQLAAMVRKPNFIYVLELVAVIAVAAIIFAIANNTGTKHQDLDQQVTVEPLPPWSPTPEVQRPRPIEKAQMERWMSSIALLSRQFTDYMSEKSFDVRIGRCGYDPRRNAYDLEYDWKHTSTQAAGSEKVTLVRMNADSIYGIESQQDVSSEITIATEAASAFTVTLLGN